MTEAYIIDACRTPRGIGKVGKGALADIHPQRLGATVLAAIRDRNSLDTENVDDVIFGTSMQAGTQGGDLARMALLDAGYDVRASGVTLDRFCGSGITANNFAAAMVMAGQEHLVIGGGTEMMSLPKKGLLPMGANNMHLQELHPQSHQGVCADAIASLEKIGRTALDEHAAESQRRAAVAIEEGRFDKSLIPVHNLDGTVALDREEFPRPGTTAESLAANLREPSALNTTADKCSKPFLMRPHAPTGAMQPPRKCASSARSAVVAAHVAKSSSGASTASVAASSARHSIASAPCPTAGSITSNGST